MAVEEAHRELITKFLATVFMRMEAGDLDMEDALVKIATAMSSFDAGEHAIAQNYMESVIAERTPTEE